MEGNSTNNIFSGSGQPQPSLASFPHAEKPASEVIEELQKHHENKASRIQELKKQIESTKTRLETKKKEIPEEKMEDFKNFSEKYNTMREEHNALLAQEFEKSDNN